MFTIRSSAMKRSLDMLRQLIRNAEAHLPPKVEHMNEMTASFATNCATVSSLGQKTTLSLSNKSNTETCIDTQFDGVLAENQRMQGQPIFQCRNVSELTALVGRVRDSRAKLEQLTSSMQTQYANLCERYKVPLSAIAARPPPSES